MTVSFEKPLVTVPAEARGNISRMANSRDGTVSLNICYSLVFFNCLNGHDTMHDTIILPEYLLKGIEENPIMRNQKTGGPGPAESLPQYINSHWSKSSRIRI